MITTEEVQGVSHVGDWSRNSCVLGPFYKLTADRGPWGSPHSGPTQLGSTPTKWLSPAWELSTGSTRPLPIARQASPLTASPLWRPKPPCEALLSKASLLPGRALPGTRTGIPKPAARAPCAGLFGPLNTEPTSGPGVWKSGGPALRFYPPAPAPIQPRSRGSTLRVRRPLGSGLPPEDPHPGSLAGSHIHKRRRSCSAAKSGPKRRPRSTPTRAARGASPRARSRASQPPSG